MASAPNRVPVEDVQQCQCAQIYATPRDAHTGLFQARHVSSSSSFTKKCHCGTHTYRAQKWMHILKTVLGWLSHVLMSPNIPLCNKQSTLLITISTLELCVRHYKKYRNIYIYIHVYICYLHLLYNNVFMHLSIEMLSFLAFHEIFFFQYCNIFLS